MRKLIYLDAAVIVLSLGVLAAALFGQTVFALALGLALLVLLTLLLLGLRRQKRVVDFLVRENRQLQKSARSGEKIQQMEKSRRQSELSALQYQINPHFLYNTLDTIRGQALMDDKKDIAQMAEKLSLFFRYSISNRDNIVRVGEEIRHIQDYLFIQKKRFGSRFETEIFLEDPDIHEYYMLKLLLQPLVENAITHGLEHMRERGKVTIGFYKTEKNLMIHIADNGVGIPEDKLFELNQKLKTSTVLVPQKPGRHSGIAVQNVNARIRITFGEEYGMHYRSEPGVGTLVVVTLPLVDDFGRMHYEEEML